MKRYALAALLAAAALTAGCGREDDGSPTAGDNRSLDKISNDLDAEVLDASPDSLVAEEPALGNGEAGATGELPVVGNEATGDAAANGM
ncbi:MAG TPA: hypothetical protein VFQ67_09900 [Allosphingosinicella sp.]|jgi:hypothetical protein|nr:hypothetical protein [Allosphingosinicella sp.]